MVTDSIQIYDHDNNVNMVNDWNLRQIAIGYST